MYDNTGLRIALPGNDPSAEQRLARSVAFAGTDGLPDKRGRIRADHRGMRLEYIPESRVLLLRGSLHTFVHGDNLGHFAPSEVAAACAELAQVVDMPADQLTVNWLEVGLNLPVADSPRSFLESLASHKSSPFTARDPPTWASRPFEYNAHHGAYRVKYYDKGTYSRRQGRHLPPNAAPHLLRYELVYKQKRPIATVTGLPAPTLADLPRPPVMAAFAAQLRIHWSKTKRRDYLNYADLPLANAALLHTATDAAFWRLMQASQPRTTYARNKGRATALLEERTGAHPYDAVFYREVERLTAPGIIA